MKEDIKEILDYFRKYSTIRENTMISEIEDYITNLQKVADERMQVILKIEQYLIDNGVDDETLKFCDIYDINGIELKKYIDKIKGE